MGHFKGYFERAWVKKVEIFLCPFAISRREAGLEILPPKLLGTTSQRLHVEGISVLSVVQGTALLYQMARVVILERMKTKREVGLGRVSGNIYNRRGVLKKRTPSRK